MAQSIIQVKIYKRRSQKILEFHDAQWTEVNREYYGKDVSWKREKRTIVAFLDKKIAGTVFFEWTGGVAYIKTIIIDKELRGQGVGAQLMAQAEKLAHQMGAHKIFLETGKTWPTNKFYLDLGYEATAEHKNHYFHQDFLVYSKFF